MPRSNLRIYIICPSEGGCFFDKVLEGFQKAAEELESYDVKVEYLQTKHHSISRQTQLLTQAIDLKPDGIMIIPASTTQLNFLIDEASDNDIPVVTVTDDAPYSKRLFYVGADNYSCGRLCGELMGNFLCGEGNIAIFSGSNELYALKQRVLGFRDKVKLSYPNMKIITTVNYAEDEETCFKKAVKELSGIQPFDGIFVTSALGTSIIAKAVEELNLPSIPKFIGFEPNEVTSKYMNDGILSALIYQDSVMQGYLALKSFYDYLSHGIVPEKECVNTRIEIVIRENIENFL